LTLFACNLPIDLVVGRTYGTAGVLLRVPSGARPSHRRSKPSSRPIPTMCVISCNRVLPDLTFDDGRQGNGGGAGLEKMDVSLVSWPIIVLAIYICLNLIGFVWAELYTDWHR
jgi:hypothetical protein